MYSITVSFFVVFDHACRRTADSSVGVVLRPSNAVTLLLWFISRIVVVPSTLRATARSARQPVRPRRRADHCMLAGRRGWSGPGHGQIG